MNYFDEISMIQNDKIALFSFTCQKHQSYSYYSCGTIDPGKKEPSYSVKMTAGFWQNKIDHNGIKSSLETS